MFCVGSLDIKWTFMKTEKANKVKTDQESYVHLTDPLIIAIAKYRKRKNTNKEGRNPQTELNLRWILSYYIPFHLIFFSCNPCINEVHITIYMHAMLEKN